jgi:L,D-peptidoglycan transpeptidase YkuD (ErfK/YbiS/YcfS/YnhG family)
MRPFALVSLVIASAAVATVPSGAARQASCARSLAQRLLPTSDSLQLVTVVAGNGRAKTAAVQLWERRDACWHPVAGPWRAHVGRNGLSANRREGDGTTPLGVFGFLPTMYGTGSDPGVRYRYHRLVCGDWWDADPQSSTYNQFRHVACRTNPPFAGASEPLWRQRIAYRYLVPLDFNTRPVVAGRGSAMFLHADTGRATAGCVSLPLPQLLETLRWLDPTAKPRIAIARP